MQRFDNTTTWFSEGESEEHLIQTEEVQAQPRKRSLLAPVLLSVAGVTIAAYGGLLLLGRRPHLPSVEPKQLPVAQIQPCGTTPPANENVNANVNVNVNANESVNANADVNAHQAEPIAHADEKVDVKENAKENVNAKGKKRGKKVAKASAPVVVAAEVLGGEKMLAQGQTGQALKQFQIAIKKDPRDVRALEGACEAEQRLGRVNEAARVCRHALALAPEDVGLRARLATIYYSGGAYQWSANEWRIVLSAHPHDAQAKKGLREAQARL